MGFHETIQPGEGERFEAFAAELVEIQKKHAEGGGKLGRALHVKQHVGAVGELLVQAPVAFRVGAFATNGQRWPLYARFSSGSSRRQGDGMQDVRGFALKLVGVPGAKIIAGLEHELTQDFLFIDQPSIPFRDPNEFMSFVRAAKDGPVYLLPRLFSGFGWKRAVEVIRRAAKTPVVSSFATHVFHTGAPISFGDTAAKLALFPLASPTPAKAHGAHRLREDLVARLQSGPIEWSLRAQFFTDDALTPIEDASVTWSGPWLELAKLTLFQQDPESDKGREIEALVETLSFDPWHSLEQHRPLGGIMRARAVAYRESVIARKAAAEPHSVLAL